MNKRQGYFLAEVLAAMTAGAMLLGIGIGVLGLLLRVERSGGQRAHSERVLARLAEQFRDDLHASRGEVRGRAAANDQWQFDLGEGRTAVYRATGESLQREEMVAGKAVRRESYALPRGFIAHVELSHSGASPVGTLTVAPTAAGSGSREIRVEAVLSWDRRFTKPEGRSR